MAGSIKEILVSISQAVSEGDELLIIESMKMENELKAPRGGVVTAVKTEAGASVDKDQVLVVVEDPEE